MTLFCLVVSWCLLIVSSFCQIEDDETVQGIFYNDIYSLELDKAKWHEIILRSVLDTTTIRNGTHNIDISAS